MPKNPSVTQFDPQQVFQRVYEEDGDILRVKETDDAVTLVEVVSDNLKYIGRSRSVDDTGQPVWLISRISTVAGTTKTQYANNSQYISVWDDRTSYFGDIPFSNSLSLFFDGNNDSVTFGDNINVERTQPFTWSFWYKPAVITQQTLFSKRESSGNSRGIEIKMLSNGRLDVILSHQGSDLIRVQTTDSIGTQEWRLITVTYDGSSTAAGLKLYLGETSKVLAVLNNALTGTILTDQAAYLGSFNNTFNFLQGNLDSVSFWNKELSALEVSELFNGGNTFNLKTHSALSNLLHYYIIGENDTFPTIYDEMGLVDGTALNMNSSQYQQDVP